ncbi:hypothetical protein [Streptomyces sp. NPDC058330]|uniref:hypothetical protein n=1 Tax=Streptomyces sp. NPDC058330 TaxID=3346449 RepID=UPI0036E90E6A
MSENHSDGRLRWDEDARGGAGGWVHTSPDGRAEPSGGPGAGPEPDAARRTVPVKYVLLAVGGGLAVAAVVLVIAHAVRPAPADAGRPAAPSASGSSSRAVSGSTEADPLPSDLPTATAEEQATAVDGLLERSASDRQQVVDAVNAVAACSSQAAVTAAKQTLDDAAVRREDLITSLAELDLDELASGSLADTLRTGWQHSADADRAFAAWADDARGCSPGAVAHTSSYRRGVSSSELATGAKEDFLSLWSPIAARYGLPERDTGEL